MSKIVIIETGGKQYLVTEGSVLTVEKLTPPVGDTVTFDKVLLSDNGTTTDIGTPYLPKVKVTGEIVHEGRAKKVTVIRYRPKSRHFVKKGHRQPFQKVRVTELQ